MTTRLPTVVFCPEVPMTTDAHVAALPVANVGVSPQMGSPMMRSWYLAKSAAVIAAQTVPVTTVTA